jgi:hypothetical protein
MDTAVSSSGAAHAAPHPEYDAAAAIRTSALAAPECRHVG